MPLESPAKPSTRRWKQPSTVRQLTAQANAVSTLLLNGKIGLDVAKAYSGILRSCAQTITAEITKARFLENAPDLTIEPEVFED